MAKNQTSIHSTQCIVLGTGFGSLSMAALLSKSGKKPTILEKANEPGGCASSYSRGGYRFDAGATTLVGYEPGLPMYELFRELDLLDSVDIIGSEDAHDFTTSSPNSNLGKSNKMDSSRLTLVRLQPSMKVHLNNGEILTRSEDKESWLVNVSKVFGEEKRQRRFWKWIFFFQDRVWDTSLRMKSFPPGDMKMFWDCLKNFRLSDLILFIASLFTMERFLKLPGMPKSGLFRKFLDEQLMITVQTDTNNSPLAMGSAGISYSHLANFYVLGGMGNLANFLVEKIRSWGGNVVYREEVYQIDRDSQNGNFQVITRRGNLYEAPLLFSGIPIWNHPRLLESSKNLGKLKKEIQTRAKRFSKGIWGAFNVSVAMKDFLSPGTCLHHQFHLSEPLPWGGGESIFVSISHPMDVLRNKNRTIQLAISTHLKNPEKWSRKDTDYTHKKNVLLEIIVRHLKTHWEGFDSSNILSVNTASPATWETWTGRFRGRVGGIPGSYFRNPFRFPGSNSQERDFYFLGDTVYPGQGIPAVMLGALNLFRRTNFD